MRSAILIIVFLLFLLPATASTSANTGVGGGHSCSTAGPARYAGWHSGHGERYNRSGVKTDTYWPWQDSWGFFNNLSDITYGSLNEPLVYIERSLPIPAAAMPEIPASSSYWYFCVSAKRYYPYIKECPGGWEKVSPPR